MSFFLCSSLSRAHPTSGTLLEMCRSIAIQTQFTTSTQTHKTLANLSNTMKANNNKHLLYLLLLVSLLESMLVHGWGFVRLNHRQKETATFLRAVAYYDDFAEWKGEASPFFSLDDHGDCGEDCEDCLIPDHYKIDPVFENFDVLAFLGIQRVQSIERNWQ